MFTEIFPILQASKKLVLKMEIDPQDPTRMLVCVGPQHPNGDKYPGLNQGVLFKNTPAELDAEFAAGLAALTPVYVETVNTVEQSIKALEEAKKAAKQPPKSLAKPGTKPGDKPADAAPKDGGKTTPAAAAPAPSAPSLFDNLESQEPSPSESEEESADSGNDSSCAPVPGEATSAAEPAALLFQTI